MMAQQRQGAMNRVQADAADSLVRNNPDRFQIVPNQDLIKGKDF
jgi:hypothetical protein